MTFMIAYVASSAKYGIALQCPCSEQMTIFRNLGGSTRQHLGSFTQQHGILQECPTDARYLAGTHCRYLPELLHKAQEVASETSPGSSW